jgi:hypothetical protein
MSKARQDSLENYRIDLLIGFTQHVWRLGFLLDVKLVKRHWKYLVFKSERFVLWLSIILIALISSHKIDFKDLVIFSVLSLGLLILLRLRKLSRMNSFIIFFTNILICVLFEVL